MNFIFSILENEKFGRYAKQFWVLASIGGFLSISTLFAVVYISYLPHQARHFVAPIDYIGISAKFSLVLIPSIALGRYLAFCLTYFVKVLWLVCAMGKSKFWLKPFRAMLVKANGVLRRNSVAVSIGCSYFTFATAHAYFGNLFAVYLKQFLLVLLLYWLVFLVHFRIPRSFSKWSLFRLPHGISPHRKVSFWIAFGLVTSAMLTFDLAQISIRTALRSSSEITLTDEGTETGSIVLRTRNGIILVTKSEQRSYWAAPFFPTKPKLSEVTFVPDHETRVVRMLRTN